MTEAHLVMPEVRFKSVQKRMGHATPKMNKPPSLLNSEA